MRLLDLLLLVIGTGGGWWMKTMWDALQKMREDFATLEKNLPREYVRKIDWDRATDGVTASIKEMRAEMADRLDQIWHELKGKADK